MSKAEEQALKVYPECMVYNDLAMEYEDINGCYRVGFEVGYNQAQQDTIEKACQLLYDWNKQMTMIFGAKAVLSCNQFTIDVDRFRKILKLE